MNMPSENMIFLALLLIGIFYSTKMEAFSNNIPSAYIDSAIYKSIQSREKKQIRLRNLREQMKKLTKQVTAARTVFDNKRATNKKMESEWDRTLCNESTLGWMSVRARNAMSVRQKEECEKFWKIKSVTRPAVHRAKQYWRSLLRRQQNLLKDINLLDRETQELASKPMTINTGFQELQGTYGASGRIPGVTLFSRNRLNRLSPSPESSRS